MTNQQNKPALQQLVDTFGSLEEIQDLFDSLLSRMTWAYTGNTQAIDDLVGDYDFIYQLKQALKKDLKQASYELKQ